MHGFVSISDIMSMNWTFAYFQTYLNACSADPFQLFLARLFLSVHQRYPSTSLFSFVKKNNKIIFQKLQQTVITYQQVVTETLRGC